MFGALFATADVSSITLLTIGVLNACVASETAGLFVLSNLFPIAGTILYLKILEAQNIDFSFDFEKFIPFGISALVIRAASATLSILRSSSRAKKWNAGLYEVLLLDSDGKKLSLEAIVNPLNNDFGLALRLAF